METFERTEAMIYLTIASLLVAVSAWLQAFAANRRIDHRDKDRS